MNSWKRRHLSITFACKELEPTENKQPKQQARMVRLATTRERVRGALGCSPIVLPEVPREWLAVGGNVSDSNFKLQAILNNTGANIERRIWVVEGILYLMNTGKCDKEVSVADLKGNQRTSNKYLCDNLCCKTYDQRTTDRTQYA